MKALTSLTVIDCASFDEFNIKIKGGEFGPMAAFWQSYIDMVSSKPSMLVTGIYICKAVNEC